MLEDSKAAIVDESGLAQKQAEIEDDETSRIIEATQ
jgi:hypothetical protein